MTERRQGAWGGEGQVPHRLRRAANCPVRRIVAVVIALAFGAATADAEATFPGRNGRIAVGGSWGGCGSSESWIWTIWPSGRGFRRLTRCEAGHSSPEWSADGRGLLFRDGTNDALAIVNASGSNRRPVDAPVRASSPSLAPDGRHLAYVVAGDSPSPPEIWRSALDGSERRLLGAGYSPRWSPDGRRIAFVGTHGLSVMDAETGEGVRVLDRQPYYNFSPVDWSPDSRRLLYVAPCCFGAIRVVRADGRGRPRSLIPARTGSRRQSSAVWSPDGKRIAFIRSRSFFEEMYVERSIWIATARGTQLRRIRSSGQLYEEVAENTDLSWRPHP